MTAPKSLGGADVTDIRTGGPHVSLYPHAPWCRQHLGLGEADSCRGYTVAVGSVETSLLEVDDRLRPDILISHRDVDTGVLRSHEVLTVRQALELADRLNWLASEAATTFEAFQGVLGAGTPGGEFGGPSR